MHIPEQLDPLLTDLLKALTHLLGANLVGVYVYGSALGSTFDPVRSDVDCIAVTERPLADDDFDRLSDWLNEAAVGDPWVKRLQLSFLIKGTVFTNDHGACLYQFGTLTRSGSDGNPIIWMDFLQRGRILFGADPKTFLQSVTAEIFHEALVRELGYLREELCGKPDSQWCYKLFYRVYATLTLCRILYSAQTGQITSKADAGRWALDHAPSDWHGLIREALENGESEGLEGFPVEHLCALIEYAQSQVDAAARS